MIKKLAIVIMGTNNAGKSTLIDLVCQKKIEKIDKIAIDLKVDDENLSPIEVAIIPSSPQERGNRLINVLKEDKIKQHNILIVAINCDIHYNEISEGRDTPLFSMLTLLDNGYDIKLFWQYPGVSRVRELNNITVEKVIKSITAFYYQNCFEEIFDVNHHWIDHNQTDDKKNQIQQIIKKDIEKEIIKFKLKTIKL